MHLIQYTRNMLKIHQNYYYVLIALTYKVFHFLFNILLYFLIRNYNFKYIKKIMFLLKNYILFTYIDNANKKIYKKFQQK